MDDIIAKLKIWLSQDRVDSIFESNADCYCRYRNIFQFRQDKFRKSVGEPLLAAVVGEIGNNSFDHNFAKWKDIVGVFFIYDLEKEL